MTQKQIRLHGMLLGVLLLLSGGTAWADDQTDCANPDQPAQAIQACTNLLKNGDLSPQAQAATYEHRGSADLNVGQNAAAVADANASLALTPTDGVDDVILGIAALNQSQYQDVIGDMTRAINLNPPDVAVAYEIRGAAEDALGSMPAAVQDENSALQMSPSNEMALYVRGDAELTLNQYNSAIADETAALQLQPNDRKALADRGDAYMHENQFPQSIADDTAAIQLNGNDPLVFMNRGISEVQFNQIAPAIADETQALSLNPNSANAYIVRGIAEGMQQDYAAEAKDEQAALQIDPSNQMAQQNLRSAQQKLGGQ
jgi:tetratricopeptide (TPR) repeat protein